MASAIRLTLPSFGEPQVEGLNRGVEIGVEMRVEIRVETSDQPSAMSNRRGCM